MTRRERKRLRSQAEEDQFMALYREQYARPLRGDLARLLWLYGYSLADARRLARKILAMLEEDDG